MNIILRVLAGLSLRPGKVIIASQTVFCKANYHDEENLANIG
jgi:hypothetical protein